MSSTRIRGSDYGRLTSRRPAKCLRLLAYVATAGSVLVGSLFVLHLALGPDQLASSNQAAAEVTLLKSRTTTGTLASERPSSEVAPAQESTVQTAPEVQANEQTKRRSRTKTSKTGSASRSADPVWPQFRNPADYAAAEGTLGPH